MKSRKMLNVSQALDKSRNMAVARALIGGGGGVYSYIRVMPD